MTDLFELSEQLIDRSEGEAPLARFDYTLDEIIDGVARVEAFSLSIIFKTSEGLVVIDTGLKNCGQPIVGSIRKWSKDPFHTLIYTHGHVDHVGGSGAFIEAARTNGHPLPNIIAQENLLPRFERYRFTDGYNRTANLRQFGQARGTMLSGSIENAFLDESVAWPTITYRDHFSIGIGELTFSLHHGKGETDDHSWVWVPEKKTICAGDFFIWRFPNAGNPQKVQRYPAEWCRALREMAGMGAEYFIPSHGLPVRGVERIRGVCLETADALDKLVRDTVEMMNRGCTLNEIIHTVRVDQDTLNRPFLLPQYDEPEFVVNNIWRLYGGWYDGNPANLKPASDMDMATEMADMAGGAEALAERTMMAAQRDNLRLACHLVEMAALAEPENKEVHEIRAEIYGRRRDAETSLMSRGIFNQAEQQSRAVSGKQ